MKASFIEEPGFGGNAKGPVFHAFFTREGGRSAGIYAGLNCGPGSSDDSLAVAENRNAAAARLGVLPSRLLTLYQIHSAACLSVSGPWPEGGKPPEADALVTATPGLAIGVLTADCAPVLFVCEGPKGPVIGAAHAGWKGAVSGILESTLAAMAALGAKPGDISACIGPCIRRDSYGVSEEFLKPFVEQDEENRRFFLSGQREGAFQFDLPAYVAHRLALAGVGEVYDTGGDTCAEEARFFSFRRATLKGEADYGRQLSAIVIRE